MKFFLLLLFFATLASAEIHKYLTEDELRQVFKAFGFKNTPKYEVVPVKEVEQERFAGVAHRLIQLKAFGVEHKLKLQETTGYLVGKKTPVWTVQSNPKDPESPIYIKNNNMLGSFATFQDKETLAAITKYTDKSNKTCFDGTFKSKYFIRPLPGRILHESKSNRRIRRALNCQDGSDCSSHHLIFEKSDVALNASHVSSKLTSEIPIDIHKPRLPPAIVYPEVLAIVDRSHYSSLGSNLEYALRYVIAFWNAIDLRYRLLKDPHVRLNVAGVVVALDDKALSYIGNNQFQLDYDKTKYLDADKGLLHKSKYFYKQKIFPHNSFDVVMTLTSLDLCNYDEQNDFCDPTTIGYAFVGAACTRFHNNQTVEAVGIVEDAGGFDGIMPTTHELGHLLGVDHDGYLTSAACSASDGYIMAPSVMLSEKGFEWSSCSRKSFTEFFSTQLSSCMDNVPPAMEKIEPILPGKMMSLDQQCQSVYGSESYACDKDKEIVCTLLNCYSKDIWWGGCTQKSAAAEGSPCGLNKHCINGKCVHESIKPTKLRQLWS